MATKKPTSRSLTTTNGKDLKQFRKTNEAIGLSVVEGNLTLLSRKVFNVLMFHAQKHKVPGTNAPINTPAAQKYFWIPLSELTRDAAYDSNDVAYFKQILESLQDIKIQQETDTQWTSERLVSSVTLVNPKGRNKHSGQVWFGFAFPPEVHEQVMMPSTYTRLSLTYQSSLKSGAALALYEICRRYLTNPTKLTAIQTYEQWYGKITGNPLSVNQPPAFKYFKRDTLRPAIAEINTHTDILIELIEHKNGRRIESFQFRVEPNKQMQLESYVQPIIDTELMRQLVRLGLSESNASDVMAEYSIVVVKEAIDRVEKRMADQSLSPLTAPAGYLKWALRDLSAAPTPEIEMLPSKPDEDEKPQPKPFRQAGESILEKFLSYRAIDALDVFHALSIKERDELFGKFKLENSGKAMNLEKGLNSTMIKALFSRWLAKELWGEPTAKALATFVERAAL